jgi:hypothetical protein
MMKPAMLAAVRLQAEDREQQQRIPLPLLPESKGDEEDCRGCERTARLQRAPSHCWPWVMASTRRLEPAGDEYGSGHVVALAVRIAALAEQDQRERARNADGSVHKEDPFPGKVG